MVIMLMWTTIVRLDSSSASLFSRNFQNVKFDAWLCWNLIALPSLRFCVKSNFGKFNQSKNVIFGNFRGSQYWLWATLKSLMYQKFKVQSLWNWQKWHFWTDWIHHNLISREIGVAITWSNFNKVKPQLHILKVSRA